MRTNNGHVKNIIISVYFVLILLAILSATVFRIFQDVTPNPYLTFFILLAIFVILIVAVHNISKYFEYDSDGVKVVIINRGLLLSDHFNYREKKLEFEKSELLKFKMKNLFYMRKLVLYIDRGNGNEKKYEFNISLVTRKKRKYIKQSLSKMIKYNRKLKDQ